MEIVYLLIGLIVTALIYLLGKNKYLSMYLYYSYNYNNLTDKEKGDFAKILGYHSGDSIDSENTAWAYAQLVLVFLFWPLILLWITVIKILGIFIKPKNDTLKK